MTVPPLPTAELTRFEQLLLAMRAAREAEDSALAGALDDVRAARRDGTADDEHDPDGPTLSAEWSRISGLREEGEAKSAAIASALLRVVDGTYGACTRCGRRIDLDRLEARPSAALCIDCARAAEGRR